jgi:N-formylmaleamate deformylase
MKKFINIFYLLALVLTFVQESVSQSATSFKVDITGKGKQSLIFIPGLTCPGAVWDETLAHLKGKYTCYVLTLPGFAGQPTVPRDQYLASMRDEVISYIHANRLKHVIIIGHSLGGFLGLSIASKEPDLVSSMIIVDSLPFMGAIQNSSETAESVRPMAEQMRSQMANANRDQVKESQKYFLPGMVDNKEKRELISQWGLDSDAKTVAQAMYELQTTDLREDISKVKCPTLILGAWIAYKQYGATKESTSKIFETQYAKMGGKKIILSDIGKHFLMYDDARWFFSNVNDFLNNPRI